MLREGQPAPDFAAADQEGHPVRLEAFRGRWLILYFYPKDMTLGCTREAIGFRDVKERLDSLGASLVGVSTDDAAAHRHFTHRCRLNFPLLVDPTRKMCRDYHAFGPLGDIIDKSSRITYIINPEGIIVKAYRFVNPMNHAQTVLRDLQVLGDRGK